MTSPSDLRTARQAHRRRRGFRLLFIAFAVFAVWTAIGYWFARQVPDWPLFSNRFCNAHPNLVCVADDLRRSPELLAGGWREWGLFLSLWSIPIGPIALFLYAAVKKRGPRKI